MRIGLVLDGSAVDRSGAALRAAAAQAEGMGLDLVWLRQDDRLVDPFLAATMVGAATSGLRVGVEAILGDVHPVVVAEQAAVCDLALGGRLILGLRADPSSADDLAEAVEVVVRSHRPRPFRSEGPRWPTPAGLEANSFMRDRTVRVTPTPAQLELPTWVAGDAAVAVRFGLPPLVTDPGAGPSAWGPIDECLGEAAVRLSRPSLVDASVAGGRLDHDALITTLLAARDTWGMDTALVTLPPALAGTDRDRVVDDLARIVRPRVQQEQIPSGLLSWWDEELVSRE